jgi:hypothetical protein
MGHNWIRELVRYEQGVKERESGVRYYGPTEAPHDVALQVAFERQTLKPAFSLDSL